MKLYFYKYNKVGFNIFPKIKFIGLTWKDKNGVPNINSVPRLEFDWLNFSSGVEFGNETYWEKKIWCKYYNDGYKEQADKNNPWGNV